MLVYQRVSIFSGPKKTKHQKTKSKFKNSSNEENRNIIGLIHRDQAIDSMDFFRTSSAPQQKKNRPGPLSLLDLDLGGSSK